MFLVKRQFHRSLNCVLTNFSKNRKHFVFNMPSQPDMSSRILTRSLTVWRIFILNQRSTISVTRVHPLPVSVLPGVGFFCKKNIQEEVVCDFYPDPKRWLSSWDFKANFWWFNKLGNVTCFSDGIYFGDL